jgi:hypothetical protein
MGQVMSSDANSKTGKTALAPIPEILAIVSHELRLLADGINDLQEVIGKLVSAGAISGSSSLYELQSIDRISQSLDAISDYLGGVSKSSSHEWKIDAAEASRCVKLADVSDRLNGITHDEASHADAGDFDDFALTG